jgi:predicted nucleotidyltransferase
MIERFSMKGKAQIAVPKAQLDEFCQRNHILKLSLFGSVLRDDFRSDSDVDVLVEFERNHVPGFIALFKMEQELSRLLGGRKVDLITEKFLNRRIRDRVLAAAEVQYAEG